MCVCVRERERERERERDRQTDRDRETDRQTETDRQREREIETKREMLLNAWSTAKVTPGRSGVYPIKRKTSLTQPLFLTHTAFQPATEADEGK